MKKEEFYLEASFQSGCAYDSNTQFDAMPCGLTALQDLLGLPPTCREKLNPFYRPVAAAARAENCMTVLGSILHV